MRPFCQVVELLPGEFAVIAASVFASIKGVHLVSYAERYRADQYAARLNLLARVYRRPRAAAAKASA